MGGDTYTPADELVVCEEPKKETCGIDESHVNAGKQPDNDVISGNTLQVACMNGDLDSVQSFLARGAEIDSKDGDGYTPLAYAVENGHTRIVKKLLEMGASIDTVSNDGRTALMCGSDKGYPDVVEVLLENGAEVDKAGRNGVTALI
ncbi:hypothetical protein F442_18349, partial [Phytophthora nicotianae P10297]